MSENHLISDSNLEWVIDFVVEEMSQLDGECPSERGMHDSSTCRNGFGNEFECTECRRQAVIKKLKATKEQS